ncbi:hypothetical protein BKA61DRAFT_663750 [Leptodontidium sp. MPI-SDFR-AT-0119]|nr:hypothetical protein BKA61DRAFT_663750 [Leptodontidium sp. MPI-SDFR-AT-0119]
MRISRGAFVIAACVSGFAAHPSPVNGLETAPFGTSILQSPTTASLADTSPVSSGLMVDTTTSSLQETSIAKSAQGQYLIAHPNQAQQRQQGNFVRPQSSSLSGVYHLASLYPTSSGSQDPLPSALETYLKSLLSKKAELPLKSILNELADGSIPTGFRSYLRDLPSESAQLPVKTLLGNLSRSSSKLGVSVTNNIDRLDNCFFSKSFYHQLCSPEITVEPAVSKEPLPRTHGSSLSDGLATTPKIAISATYTSDIRPLFTPTTSATPPAKPIFSKESPLPAPAVSSDGLSIEIARFPAHTADKSYARSSFQGKSLYRDDQSVGNTPSAIVLASPSGESGSIAGTLFTSHMWVAESVRTTLLTILPSSGLRTSPKSLSRSLSASYVGSEIPSNHNTNSPAIIGGEASIQQSCIPVS